MPKPLRDSLLAVLALAAALAAAYTLDGAIFWAHQRAIQTFDFTLSLWLPGLAQLLLVVGLIALVALLLRSACPRAVDLLYLLIGLAALFAVPLVFTLNLSIPLYGLFESGPVSLWSSTSTALALAGALHLFRRRPLAAK